MAHSHSHDGVHTHSHDQASAPAEHGHTHEILDGPGSYMGREMPIIEGRDWSERAFTVGIGGYVTFFCIERNWISKVPISGALGCNS
jgi:urease accessory protein